MSDDARDISAERQPSRRAFLRQAGVGATIAWVAPAVTSFEVAAAASHRCNFEEACRICFDEYRPCVADCVGHQCVERNTFNACRGPCEAAFAVCLESHGCPGETPDNGDGQGHPSCPGFNSTPAAAGCTEQGEGKNKVVCCL